MFAGHWVLHVPKQKGSWKRTDFQLFSWNSFSHWCSVFSRWWMYAGLYKRSDPLLSLYLRPLFGTSGVTGQCMSPGLNYLRLGTAAFKAPFGTFGLTGQCMSPRLNYARVYLGLGQRLTFYCNVKRLIVIGWGHTKSITLKSNLRSMGMWKIFLLIYHVEISLKIFITKWQ